MNIFDDADRKLKFLDEIVLTAETIQFYRDKNNTKGINKELDTLKEQIKEYKDYLSTLEDTY